MKRSKLELCLDILGVLKNGNSMKPTQIMYKVNICYMYLERYLEFLVEQNLVERKAEDGSRVRYKITQKGLVLLGIYGELTHALHVRRTTKESSNTIIMED